MIVTVHIIRLSATVLPSSGKLLLCSIQQLGRSEIVSPRVFWVLSSWVIYLDSHQKITLLWGSREDSTIYVSDGSDTVISGAYIAPPLTGKRDVLFYLSHVLLLLASKSSSDAVSNLNCIL